MINKKVILIPGNFNVLHPGHLKLFMHAKRLGGYLVVGVNSDHIAGSAVSFDQNVRLSAVKSHALVDDAFIIRESISEVISDVRPDIVLKGREHQHLENPELLALEHYGGRLLFGTGDVGGHPSSLVKQNGASLLPITDQHIRAVLKQYSFRHKFVMEDLKELVERFSTMSIVVFGDIIVDEYIESEALGMSREDSTVVIRPFESRKFLGGAGIVASHAASLGVHTTLVAIKGKDSTAGFAEEKLAEYGVKSCLVEEQSRPTSLKQRYRIDNKTHFRVSQLRQDAVSTECERDLNSLASDLISDPSKLNAIIFSDFNYGAIPSSLVHSVLADLAGSGLTVAADSQSSSQAGDLSKYIGASYVSPTEFEARSLTSNLNDGLVVLASQVFEQIACPNVILTLGEDGVLVRAESGHTDMLPAINQTAIDVSGAGDSFLVLSTLCLAAGADLFKAAFLGSVAAAIQVGRVGNEPITAAEIIHVLHGLEAN